MCGESFSEFYLTVNNHAMSTKTLKAGFDASAAL